MKHKISRIKDASVLRKKLIKILKKRRADKEWKKDEEKAARYILASANYATIYKTVCNQK